MYQNDGSDFNLTKGFIYEGGVEIMKEAEKLTIYDQVEQVMSICHWGTNKMPEVEVKWQ